VLGRGLSQGHVHNTEHPRGGVGGAYQNQGQRQPSGFRLSGGPNAAEGTRAEPVLMGGRGERKAQPDDRSRRGALIVPFCVGKSNHKASPPLLGQRVSRAFAVTSLSL
jgi:hypothetical protein